MSEQPENPVPADDTRVADEPVAAQPDAAETTTFEPAPAPPAWIPPPPPPETASTGAVADRPEIAIGAAFAGGLALALVLKRLAR